MSENTGRLVCGSLRICPERLPVLIHDPGRLAGILPGAEDLRPAEHED